ncbi:hypothetical protein GFF04_09000, partial [Salmonella enterica]|nr:hypothetical protein [Salmonella enterica]
FGDGSQRLGSISFFHNVTEWPVDENCDVENIKYNIATIRMPEELMLKLADFIRDQHDKAKTNES